MSSDATGLREAAIPMAIFYGLSDFGSNRVWDRTYRYSGMHRDAGTFIAHGPDVRGGESFAGGSIVDLAPTVLHWLGAPVPADMDGRPLLSIMRPDYVEAHPVDLVRGEDDGADAVGRDYSDA